MTWAEAKAATNYEEAKRILRERQSAADNGTAPAPKARRVTLRRWQPPSNATT